MKKRKKRKASASLQTPYWVLLVIFAWFAFAGFLLERPGEILDGLLKISFSRSVLITDYIAIGGIGATLLNAALVGAVGVLMMAVSRVEPSGAIIMALWMTAGFSCFGKTLLNMIPLHCGVWLFARLRREPFTKYALASLMVATLSPSVSELGFLGVFSRPVELIIGMATGFFIGFIFPMISRYTSRATAGYNLYNMGFAGGIISTMLVSLLMSVGIEIPAVFVISSGNNRPLTVFLYITALALILYGLFTSGGVRKLLSDFRRLHRQSGQLPTDFYFMFGNSVYVNMGILCAFATTLVLLLGAELNGPAIAGIFTITGFGCFGKHLRNVAPLFAGAVISAYVNQWDPRDPINIIAILFSTGLAPIAGEFGMIWGMIAGFLHVNIAMHVGYLTSGMNLYNNGFAAGFVAMFTVPLITIFTERFSLKTVAGARAAGALPLEEIGGGQEAE